MPKAAYPIITGAGVAEDIAPDLIAGLAVRFPTVLTLLTPNAARVVNARDLSRQPGHPFVVSLFSSKLGR